MVFLLKIFFPEDARSELFGFFGWLCFCVCVLDSSKCVCMTCLNLCKEHSTMPCRMISKEIDLRNCKR